MGRVFSNTTEIICILFLIQEVLGDDTYLNLKIGILTGHTTFILFSLEMTALMCRDA